MTSSRAYATPRSAAQATQELRRCAGTQFDPALVAAFAAAWRAAAAPAVAS